MLKKSKILLFSLLSYLLTSPITVWAKENYDPDATFPRTLKDWTATDGSCWFCGVFEILFKAINNLATQMAIYMSDFFLTLMCIGILFLIAFKVGKMVVQLQEVDLMQFLGDLFKPLGRAIVATALLAAFSFKGDNIYHFLIQPVFDVSLFLGQQILAISTNSMGIQMGSQLEGVMNTDINNPVFGACTYHAKNFPANTAFTALELEQMMCWLQTVASSLAVGIAIGSTFIKIAFKHFLTSFHLLVPGLIIFAAFFWNYVLFPLKLLEAIIRFAFIMALMPLWIVLWVFPITASYTKKAWDMFLGSCVLLIALSVIVGIVLQMMNHSIQPSGVAEELFRDLMYDKTDGAVQKVEAGGVALLIMAAFGFMAWSILNSASVLASTFASVGGSLGVEQGVGGNLVRGAALGYKAGKTSAKYAYSKLPTMAALTAGIGSLFKGKGDDSSKQSAVAAPKGRYKSNALDNYTLTPQSGNNGSENNGQKPISYTADMPNTPSLTFDAYQDPNKKGGSGKGDQKQKGSLNNPKSKTFTIDTPNVESMTIDAFKPSKTKEERFEDYKRQNQRKKEELSQLQNDNYRQMIRDNEAKNAERGRLRREQEAENKKRMDFLDQNRDENSVPGYIPNLGAQSDRFDVDKAMDELDRRDERRSNHQNKERSVPQSGNSSHMEQRNDSISSEPTSEGTNTGGVTTFTSSTPYSGQSFSISSSWGGSQGFSTTIGQGEKGGKSTTPQSSEGSSGSNKGSENK